MLRRSLETKFEKKKPDPEHRIYKLSFWSIIPGIHLWVLWASWRIQKQKKGFQPKTWFALGLGGFFTALYLLVAIAWFGLEAPRDMHQFDFIADAEPHLESVSKLLNQVQISKAESELNRITESTDTSWAVLSARAIIHDYRFEKHAALKGFQKAAIQTPESAEFYYYYGKINYSLENDTEALMQFRKALSINPRLAMATRYIHLIENRYEPNRVMQGVTFFIIILFLLTVHEWGHAWSAYQLGDDTAKHMGRVTLNPIPHIDPVGTILLPAILLIQGSPFMFGWAKPVPVVSRRLRHPIRDDIAVSFAGPAMNFLVAMIGVILLMVIGMGIRVIYPLALGENFTLFSSGVSISGTPIDYWLVVMIVVIKQMIITSLVLGIFNLIPIPPLDGSHILSNVLPTKARIKYEMLRPYSMIIFLVLIMSGLTRHILWIPLLPMIRFLNECLYIIGLG